MANRALSNFAWKLSLSLLALVFFGFTLLVASNLRKVIDQNEAGTLAAEFITSGHQKYEIVSLDALPNALAWILRPCLDSDVESIFLH